MMKPAKNQLIASFLAVAFILFALIFCIFGNDYKITVMVVAVWASMLLLRSAFPKYFGGRYALYIINFFVLCALMNIGKLLFDQYIEYKLYQFDIDHDLIFSPEEQTAEQQKYWMWFIGDGGRNVFMPIITLLVSLGSTFLLFFIVKLFGLKNKESKTPK